MSTDHVATGKTTELLSAPAAVLLNALKELAGLDHKLHLISPEALEPITQLRNVNLGIADSRLHCNEVLIALSISSATDENAKKALEQLPNLAGLEMHSTVMLTASDEDILRRLHMNITCEPRTEYHK